jgi:hypothetical protein
MTPDSKFHHARFLTPFDPEDSRYKQKFVWSIGAHKNSKSWFPDPKTPDVATMLSGLAQPTVGKKDGRSFVPGDMAKGQRLWTAIKAVHAIVLDFDKGTPSAKIDSALIKLERLALRYTTHSHGKTQTDIRVDAVTKFAPGAEIDTDLMRRFLSEQEGWDPCVIETVEYVDIEHKTRGNMARVNHAPMEKNRVVIPLASPFVIVDEGATQREGIAKYAKVVGAMAEMLGLLDALDMTCTQAFRLYHFPRHDEGMKWDIAICGGDLFEWRTLELENPYEAIAREASRGKPKSKTAEGLTLGRWSRDHAEGFQIADLINDHCHDKNRGNASQGFHIECPHDEDHSNAGDANDRACYVVNGGEGQSPVFTIQCQHDSCRDKTNLDHLGKMLADGWFSRDVLTDDAYNPEVVDGENSGTQAVGSTEHATFDKVQQAVETLRKDSTTNDKDAVLRLMSKVDLSDMERDELYQKIRAKTGTGTRIVTLRNTHEAYRKEERAAARGSKGQDKLTKNVCDALTRSLGRLFEFPPEDYGDFRFVMFDRKPWMARGDKPLCTPFVLSGGTIAVDRGERHARRLYVLNAIGRWQPVDIDAGALASKNGQEMLGRLYAAGWASNEDGHDFALQYLRQSQPETQTIYHRPGNRDGCFICPTGEVLLGETNATLANEVRLKCPATGGTFDAWRAAATDVFAMPKAWRFHAGLLLGLVGNLADLMGTDSFVVYLGGESRHGKSTTQEAAVAHWAYPYIIKDKDKGKSEPGLFRPANATKNSHEVFIELASGTCAAYDEIGSLGAEIQELIFTVQGGVGRQRLDRNGDPRKVRTWGGTVLFLSAEIALAEILRKAKAAQRQGLSVRCISIAYDESALLPEADFRRVEEMISNFGWSGSAFVEALAEQGYVKNPEKLKAEIDALIAQLPGTTGTGNAYKRSAARPIGYMWAAGLIAEKAGLTPAGFDYEALARRVWQDTCASDIGPTDPAERAIATLIDSIHAQRGRAIVDYENLDERGAKEIWGYFNAKHKIADADGDITNRDVYVLRSNKLGELSGGTMSDRALRAKLYEAGMLVQKKGINTWSGFGSLGKGAQYVVLLASEIDSKNDPDAVGERDAESESAVRDADAVLTKKITGYLAEYVAERQAGTDRTKH